MAHSFHRIILCIVRIFLFVSPLAVRSKVNGLIWVAD